MTARRFPSALALAGILAIAGCTTASVTDLAPTAAVTPADVPVPQQRPAAEAAASNGARDTGAFPDLNTPPAAATAQVDEAEKNRKIAELLAARASQGNAPASRQAEALRLKKLAREHGRKVLEEIE
ncbi:MAG: hypothetical protein WAT70_01385 [Rhizobiaceae bacterium]